jgi:hypothetical protein
MAAEAVRVGVRGQAATCRQVELPAVHGAGEGLRRVPHRYGGLGVGRGLVGLILTFVIIGFVGYLTVTRKDVEEPAVPRAPRRGGHHRQEA